MSYRYFCNLYCCRICSSSRDVHSHTFDDVTATSFVFGERRQKTLVQPTPAVLVAPLLSGEGLELLFIKAMCIIDNWLYNRLLSCFYHACAMYWCLLLVVAVFFVDFYYYWLHWHFVFCWFVVAITCWYTCGFIGPSLKCACICCQSSNPV